ncbi:oxo-acid lyase, partial [Bacillus cereus]|nr:oxo-acid lyase [Bacillus cereus]
RANLGEKDSCINSLVSTTGKVGDVNISTGPISEAGEEIAFVLIKTAIAFVRDIGGNSLKYLPMKGLAHDEKYRAVAKACAAEGIALEPTGGIYKENFETIVRIELEANIEQVITSV